MSLLARTNLSAKANAAGFTLLELMVAVAVLAIIVTIGIPSFSSFIRTYQMDSAQQQIISAHALARNEAIKSGSSVGVCGASASSPPVCSVDDWSGGWMVYTVADNELLRIWDSVSPVEISVNESSVFEPTGALLSGRNEIEVSLSDEKYCLSVLFVGQIAIEEKACDE